MFQWISIISFGVIIAGLFLHYLVFPCGYKPRFSLSSIIRKKVHLFTLIFPEQKLSLPGKIRKLVFLVALLSFLVLFLTGFGPVLFGGKLHGWLLMIHATFALVFIACTAIVVFLGAGQYVFNKKDLDGFPCPRWKLKKPSSCWMADSGVGAKAGFWMLTVLILPVTLTMVLSMLPLFGTAGQELMYHLHRWCALLFSWIAIVELYMLIRMEVRKDMDPQN